MYSVSGPFYDFAKDGFFSFLYKAIFGGLSQSRTSQQQHLLLQHPPDNQHHSQESHCRRRGWTTRSMAKVTNIVTMGPQRWYWRKENIFTFTFSLSFLLYLSYIVTSKKSCWSTGSFKMSITSCFAYSFRSHVTNSSSANCTSNFEQIMLILTLYFLQCAMLDILFVQYLFAKWKNVPISRLEYFADIVVASNIFGQIQYFTSLWWSQCSSVWGP